MSSRIECLKFEERACPLISGHLDFAFIAGERLDCVSPDRRCSLPIEWRLNQYQRHTPIPYETQTHRVLVDFCSVSLVCRVRPGMLLCSSGR